MFFPHKKIISLRICLYKEDAYWAHWDSQISRFCKAFRIAAWFKPSADLLHIPGMSQKHPHTNSLRPDTTEQLPLQRWCSLLHSSQTGWFPSALQTSARQSSRPPWSWGRRFCFPLKKWTLRKVTQRERLGTELQAIIPQNRCALDSRVESIFRSRMPRWRQSWTLSEQWKVQTHLIFGTRRHSSGWFHVAIVWRWRRTRHSWRRIPLWPHAFPCSIWTCTRGRETRSASDIQKLVDSQKLWLDLKTYSHAVSAQKNTKSASATSQMLSSLRWINNSNSWLK